jgi:hypothetical protein
VLVSRKRRRVPSDARDHVLHGRAVVEKGLRLLALLNAGDKVGSANKLYRSALKVIMYTIIDRT